MSELEKKTLEKLFQLIKTRNGENAELSKDEIKVGETIIKVSVSVEFDSSKENSWIFAAKYDAKIFDKSETLISIGSIGIGKDRNDAVETSIDEWIAMLGTALSEMLAKSEGVPIGNFKVYSGLMGIRGEKPSQGWLDGSPEMNKKLIEILLPIIKKSNKELTSVNLTLTVNEIGEVDGECRLNNEVSKEILDKMKKLDWEKSSTSYMFKQFYLINKNQTPK